MEEKLFHLFSQGSEEILSSNQKSSRYFEEQAGVLKIQTRKRKLRELQTPEKLKSVQDIIQWISSQVNL